MADQTTLYDLVLLLSSDAPDERKTRILSAVESAISGGGGSIERNDDWGRRPMAYEIRHSPEAEYHLLQFQAPPSLIEDFSHTLRITDGVLRHRIIKVTRGTPAPKPGAPPVVSAVASPGTSASDGGRPSRGPAPAPEQQDAPSSEEPEATSPETLEQHAGEQAAAEAPPAQAASPAAEAGDASPAAE